MNDRAAPGACGPVTVATDRKAERTDDHRADREPQFRRAAAGTASNRGQIVLAAVVGALVSALVTTTLPGLRDEPVGVAPQRAATVSVTNSARTNSDVAGVAQAILPAVARVDVRGANGEGSGSAVVFRSDGYLVTNNHVVDNAADVAVTLADSAQVPAEIVGTDPGSDLAVLRIDRTDLPVPAFAPGNPQIGEPAIAVGSPFGLDSTVTAGIVSATARVVGTPGSPLVGMVQTDAAINPGNSGGALVNERAELLGINTSIVSQSGQNGGIGFAVPADVVASVAEQLVAGRDVEYAQLGVQGHPVTIEIAERLQLPDARGALVVTVTPGSAAEAAGLQREDVITAIDDQPVSSQEDLFSAIRGRAPGDRVSITLFRDGGTLRLDATLGAAPPRG